MPEPIEIKPEDIIRRPANLPIGTDKTDSGGGFSVKNIKSYFKELKELKETMESMGFDLSRLGFKTGGQNQGAGMPDTRSPAPAGAQQFRNVLKLLEMRYGDVTINELLEKLKAEFGDWKISNFTKGGMF